MNNPPLIVVGVDPGTTMTAFCVWDGATGKILDKGKIANETFRVEYLPKYKVYPRVVIACEHLQCFGMAVGKEVFETAYFIGDLRRTVLGLGMVFQRIYRSEVKMHHCHTMKAKDTNIRQALVDRFGAPGKKACPGVTYGLAADMWSAFAIAVMTFDKATQITHFPEILR